MVVAGVADPAQYVTLVDALAGGDCDAAVLEMSQKDLGALAGEQDVIAGQVHGVPFGGMKVGEAVDRSQDSAGARAVDNVPEDGVLLELPRRRPGSPAQCVEAKNVEGEPLGLVNLMTVDQAVVAASADVVPFPLRRG